MSLNERKRVGNTGESAAAIYLARHGFAILGRNIARKTGELDIVARNPEGSVIHIVEVKTLGCGEFPRATENGDQYDPAANLHQYKIRKIARTAEWYLSDIGWEGEWQIDGILVWLRARDGKCLVRYLPQIA